MDKDSFSQQILENILKTDPYFVKYSPDVLMKKTKCLDIFNSVQKMFNKNESRSSPWEIWIRFLEINGSPSLKNIVKYLHLKILK